MTDHLYTPASMRSNAGATKFKGKDATLTSLLEAASEAGLDLEHNHGTIEFSKTSYAEMDYYTYSRYDRYCDGSSFSWGETTDSTYIKQLWRSGHRLRERDDPFRFL